ncbi:MAG: formate dehydrogenase accessory sulfurtransferase FdhD [Acetivibrionales bacterium]|jgi:formate dehydrogenase assembly factor FdhD
MRREHSALVAVKAAREIGVTLIGFTRGDGMNVYCMPERLEIN